MKRIIKKILYVLIGIKLTNQLKNLILQKTIPVHLANIFGFSIYQSDRDIINYSKFSNKSVEEVMDIDDGRTIKNIFKYLSPGDTAIDIGANI